MCQGSLKREGMKEKPSRGQESSIIDFQHFPLCRPLNSFRQISRIPHSKFVLIISLFSQVTVGLRGICLTRSTWSREPWGHQPQDTHGTRAVGGCRSRLGDQDQPPAMHALLPLSPPRAWIGPGAAPAAVGTAWDRALVLAPSDPTPRNAQGAWTLLVAEPPGEMLVPTATPICITKTKQLALDASEEATRESLEGQTEKTSQPQTAFPYPKSCVRFPSHSRGERDAQQLRQSRRERSRPGVQPQTVLAINSPSR